MHYNFSTHGLVALCLFSLSAHSYAIPSDNSSSLNRRSIWSSISNIISTAKDTFTKAKNDIVEIEQQIEDKKNALINSLDNLIGNDYAPKVLPASFCPNSTSQPLVWDADQQPLESAWVQGRQTYVRSNLTAFLDKVGLTGFDDLVKSDTPTIALAFSGGGYRAMLNGAGAVSAFDKNTVFTEKGDLGGLLQSSTYISGLSGGGWLLGSLLFNDFPTIQEITSGSRGANVWDLTTPIYEPDEDYAEQVLSALIAKYKAGFHVTVTDLWGLLLLQKWVANPEDNFNTTFSSFATTDSWIQMFNPFPLIIANVRDSGQTLMSSNSTVMEINPLGVGSYDTPVLDSFARTKYLGSDLFNGTIQQGGHCVTGFDSASLLMGTSSNVFNAALTYNLTRIAVFQDHPELANLTHVGIEILADDDLDVANWSPNPFYGVNNQGQNLTLGDGSEDGQNVPLWPLLQPYRKVDVIFAVDSSSDTINNWPNGSSLVATYERSKYFQNIPFPPVPDVNTFINNNLTTRPTWFGCNTTETPLIVYLPNSPYSYESNTSTFQMEYSDEERDAMIVNGLNVVTMGNGTYELELNNGGSQTPDWDYCVGCATILRAMQKSAQGVSAGCNLCMQTYCWDGQTNTTTPAVPEPSCKVAGAC